MPMPPHIIIMGMPLPIMVIMRLQHSRNMSLDMSSIGIISQTMPFAVILQVILAIIIGIIMPPIGIMLPIIGIIMPFMGMPPIIGFIIGIMPFIIIGFICIAGVIPSSIIQRDICQRDVYAGALGRALRCRNEAVRRTVAFLC
jgi:hypothetical protein